jgi:hypothetical protein
MAKIPDCSSAQNLGGNSLDNNTVSEGTCTLDGGNGATLNI